MAAAKPRRRKKEARSSIRISLIFSSIARVSAAVGTLIVSNAD